MTIYKKDYYQEIIQQLIQDKIPNVDFWKK